MSAQLLLIVLKLSTAVYSVLSAVVCPALLLLCLAGHTPLLLPPLSISPCTLQVDAQRRPSRKRLRDRSSSTTLSSMLTAAPEAKRSSVGQRSSPLALAAANQPAMSRSAGSSTLRVRACSQASKIMQSGEEVQPGLGVSSQPA